MGRTAKVDSRLAHIIPIVSTAVPTLRERLFPFLHTAWLAAGVALAVFAYRDLLRFERHVAIPDPVERMLFEPADTTPAVVLALVLWLVWRRRERWRGLASRPGPVALTLPLLAVGAAILVWSRLTGADDLLALSAIASGLGLVSLAKGAPGVRLLWLPAAFLLFALPLPAALANALIFRFQLWTAALAGELLFLFGIPAHVSGITVLRPDYRFLVIEGCSGLRSVLTLSMLAVLMVDLFRRRGEHALLVVLAAPFVAFALNAVRAVALILNPSSAIASVHVAQGVAILLCGLLVLYALDGALARVFPAPHAGVPAGAPAAGSLSPARGGLALGYLALLVLGSAGVARWAFPERPSAALEARLGVRLGEWRVAEPLAVDRVFLGSVSFRERFAARYRQDGDTVELFLGVGFRGRRYASPLSPKTQILEPGWVVAERWPLEEGPGRAASEGLLLRSGTRWLLVEHWVEASGDVAVETLRSLLTLDATPWRQPTDPIVVRIATRLSEPGAQERGQAQARLRRFRASLAPVLESLLNQMDRESPGGYSRKGFS
jgi:EpsI family protein